MVEFTSFLGEEFARTLSSLPPHPYPQSFLEICRITTVSNCQGRRLPKSCCIYIASSASQYSHSSRVDFNFRFSELSLFPYIQIYSQSHLNILCFRSSRIARQLRVNQYRTHCSTQCQTPSPAPASFSKNDCNE